MGRRANEDGVFCQEGKCHRWGSLVAGAVAGQRDPTCPILSHGTALGLAGGDRR